MQETWTFDFPSSDISEHSLSRLLGEKEMDLGIFLSYYYKKQGAVAENVKLKSAPNFSSPTSGSFILDFDLVFFNACLAIHEQERDTIQIQFEIDKANSKLKLIGPYWPERGMDEI